MKYCLTILLLFCAGCGAQGTLLGTENGYLLSVYDTMALPGEQVQLRVHLQGGPLLGDRQGHTVLFLRDGTLFKAAQTDDKGFAAVDFTPTETGDVQFTVALAPRGFPDAPPRPTQLLVACRDADAPMLVVDLDHTVVASDFTDVMLGKAAAMPGSPEVMRHLAERYTIIYLTARPNMLSSKSRAWLGQRGFPRGSLMTADISQFLQGSGKFKSQVLAKLATRFHQVKLGIGDQISDVTAYHDNGVAPILILTIDQDASPHDLLELSRRLDTLPEGVQVVFGWDQIDQAVFGGKAFPASAAMEVLWQKILAKPDSQPAGGEE